jgi:hypothetical protein
MISIFHIFYFSLDMSTYSLCFFSQILKSHLFLKWSPHVLPNFRGSPTPGPRPQDAGGIPVPRDAELLPGHGAIVLSRRLQRWKRCDVSTPKANGEWLVILRLWWYLGLRGPPQKSSLITIDSSMVDFPLGKSTIKRKQTQVVFY